MTDAVDLGAKLDTLAAKMIERVLKDDVPIPHQVDVFKICSQHYATVHKVKGKPQDTDNSPMTMDGLRSRVANSEDEEDESTASSE